jgi:peptidoglycan/LPS O-acetylase OafA/YrhL
MLLLLVAAHALFMSLGWEGLLFDDVHPMVSPARLSGWQWAGNVSLTEAWRSRLIGDRTQFYLAPSWTLCYEEQFYAVCGLLLLAGRRFFRSALLGLTGIVIAIAFVHHLVVKLPIGGFFFDGRWLPFAAGVLVFYRLQYPEAPLSRRAMPVLGIAFAAAVLWRILHRSNFGEEFIVAFAFAMLLVFLHRWDLQIATSRLLLPVTFCGAMCYSLYLTHWPVAKGLSHLLYRLGVQGEWPTLLVTIPVSIMASVALAWVFHLAVERRFLNTPPVLFTLLRDRGVSWIPAPARCAMSRLGSASPSR